MIYNIKRKKLKKDMLLIFCYCMLSIYTMESKSRNNSMTTEMDCPARNSRSSNRRREFQESATRADSQGSRDVKAKRERPSKRNEGKSEQSEPGTSSHVLDERKKGKAVLDEVLEDDQETYSEYMWSQRELYTVKSPSMALQLFFYRDDQGYRTNTSRMLKEIQNACSEITTDIPLLEENPSMFKTFSVSWSYMRNQLSSFEGCFTFEKLLIQKIDQKLRKENVFDFEKLAGDERRNALSKLFSLSDFLNRFSYMIADTHSYYMTMMDASYLESVSFATTLDSMTEVLVINCTSFIRNMQLKLESCFSLYDLEAESQSMQAKEETQGVANERRDIIKTIHEASKSLRRSMRKEEKTSDQITLMAELVTKLGAFARHCNSTMTNPQISNYDLSSDLDGYSQICYKLHHLKSIARYMEAEEYQYILDYVNKDYQESIGKVAKVLFEV